mmetsp:Transcript_17991/g.24929  ORF Transcript_17991/g.24929 Transcript_17991/m.24929 type:complete len:261 (-) Transcript_17991:401-1183(-)
MSLRSGTVFFERSPESDVAPEADSFLDVAFFTVNTSFTAASVDLSLVGGDLGVPLSSASNAESNEEKKSSEDKSPAEDGLPFSSASKVESNVSKKSGVESASFFPPLDVEGFISLSSLAKKSSSSLPDDDEPPSLEKASPISASSAAKKSSSTEFWLSLFLSEESSSTSDAKKSSSSLGFGFDFEFDLVASCFFAEGSSDKSSIREAKNASSSEEGAFDDFCDESGVTKALQSSSPLTAFSKRRFSLPLFALFLSFLCCR